MRVVLVDDHEEVRAMVRVALTTRPRLRVVGEAASLNAAVDIAAKLRPEAIVLDLVLPDAGQRQSHGALTAIREAAPTSEVVVYTAWESARTWYERQGIRFFGKATDQLDDLVSFLDAPRPTDPA